MGLLNMRRPPDKHIDEQELDALVTSLSEDRESDGEGPPGACREIKRHVDSCVLCSRKVLEYQHFISSVGNLAVSVVSTPGPGCPRDNDVDWHEVAAGLWPELKAQQLIMHASTCAHCGPLLRAATNASDDASPAEESLLAQLRTPSRPVVQRNREAIPPCPKPHSAWQQLLDWKIFVPALACVVIVGLIGTKGPSSRALLSGSQLAEFAVTTHRQYEQGRLTLDLHSDSQQTVNQWFEGKTKFAVTVPVSSSVDGTRLPYHVEGARLVHVGAVAAAYIAYRIQSGPVSLIVIPDSVAVASGGTLLKSKNVSFHYGMVGGYKVVTWSVHGLTYALVSEEGNRSQRSCMVCHSALGDRDLSNIPTPLYSSSQSVEPLSQ